MAEERVRRRLAAILAADVVGYSRLVGVDEAGTIARLRTLRVGCIEPLIVEYSGRLVKLMGDGALVAFTGAIDAVECAVAMQRDVAEREAGEPESRSGSWLPSVRRRPSPARRFSRRTGRAALPRCSRPTP